MAHISGINIITYPHSIEIKSLVILGSSRAYPIMSKEPHILQGFNTDTVDRGHPDRFPDILGPIIIKTVYPLEVS